jgi:ribose-phosphate pyrophosphokinase
MAEPSIWSPSKSRSSAIAGDRFRLFALEATAEFGKVIAAKLGLPPSPHEERGFEDGEHKSRPLTAVQNADVYVVQSLHAGPAESANDKLCRLLFFIGALKDAGAARVTAAVPYLCYARKDRRTKVNDPVTSRYVAALFEAVGTDAIITLEVHNPAAFENAFRCRTVALTVAPLFVEYARRFVGEKLCVISPDTGGAKRADLFRQALQTVGDHQIGSGFVEKHRSAGVVSGDLFVGDVEGATALVIDDLISTGNTLLRAAKAARRHGAIRVVAMVTHGLFMSGSAELFADPVIDRLVVTDTVPAFRLGPGSARDKLDILPAAPLFAEAISRLQDGRGLADLLAF